MDSRRGSWWPLPAARHRGRDRHAVRRRHAPDRVWPSWLSPIGWGQQAAPYTANDWWPVLLHLGFAALLVAGVFALQSVRDSGAGLIAERPGRPAAPATLSGVVGLAWHLQRPTIIGWTVGGPSAGSWPDRSRARSTVRWPTRTWRASARPSADRRRRVRAADAALHLGDLLDRRRPRSRLRRPGGDPAAPGGAVRHR